ncbi:hypothetical protein PRECH8_03770 [Insulibacter thermoxylanivorax]|uniref:Small acid-soluble spore protein H (Minor) n=1 Tax=Insulibacter thermoxylanivorax TaxID=2749268 RepID=A0A916QEL4_9BACL|nr:H-type small acid-soluble spore protein [Insulibacter thermoxylanivorax]GFR37081.1 hypothetical protein PRECH8_03770 [Insulibacter thermoxylanivorax]
MDLERAQEILHAEETIPVTLNGERVWIESVDPSRKEVQVHLERDPNVRKSVSPQQLTEIQ